MCMPTEREALQAQRCKAKSAPSITRKRTIENTVLSQESTLAAVNETIKEWLSLNVVLMLMVDI